MSLTIPSWRRTAEAWRALRVPIGRRPARPAERPTLPDWAAASPARIARAYAAASVKSAGGWYAVDDSRRIGTTPVAYMIAGTELVLWRDEAVLHAAPASCPHLGASLAGAHVKHGCLVCPWHGLALGPEGHGAWRHNRAHDDGVLAWVQLDDGDIATDLPILPPRPQSALSAVIRQEGRCEPEHIIRNRLDPWHGAHFHPYAFCDLEVVSATDDALDLHVAFRVLGPIVVDVVARFTCSDRRTITMTIIDGEGVGSVVETHATPIAPGRTAVIEATIATSERSGFRAAEAFAPIARPFMAMTANQLWADDLVYAERLYELERRATERSAKA